MAYEILKDPYYIAIVSDPMKWEKINPEKFEEKGIEKNVGNLDPIRDEIIGKVNGELYLMVTTFRGDVGDLSLRIISLRKLNMKDHKKYFDIYNNSQSM